MPVYVYKCPVCEDTKDVVLSVTEVNSAIVTCPAGLASTGMPTLMRRVFTPPAIKFIGSGFYSNGG